MPTTEQTEARAAWRQSGGTMSGTQLGDRYGKSPRWGRQQIEAARAEDAASVPAARNGTNGSAAVVPAATSDRDPKSERHSAPLTRELTVDPQRRPWWATAVTVLVALVAAAASYGHQLEVAKVAGEPELIAHAVPLTVDGLVVAALWAGDRGRWWLRLALAVSVAANVAAAEPTTLGYAVAGWPPLALYGCDRLLHGGRR